MKKKDKYKLISYALNEYSEIFKCQYEKIHIDKNRFIELFKEYKHPSMCEWSYCCRGLYQNCWQEVIAEGIWFMTQESVNLIILNIFSELYKTCKKDNRIGMYKDDIGIHMAIIARDLPKYRCDYLITFTNEEW